MEQEGDTCTEQVDGNSVSAVSSRPKMNFKFSDTFDSAFCSRKTFTGGKLSAFAAAERRTLCGIPGDPNSRVSTMASNFTSALTRSMTTGNPLMRDDEETRGDEAWLQSVLPGGTAPA
eukprot:6465410-Prymnesium_polylepis.1